MSVSDAYRNELAAAQARISQLEKIVRERSANDAKASTIAALLRERARAVENVEPRNAWAWLKWRFLIFGVVAIGFVVDGDWLFGGLALVAPFVMGLVGQRMADANAAAASRQVALIDERLAELERDIVTDVGAPEARA
jgi:hypothetical protein